MHRWSFVTLLLGRCCITDNNGWWRDVVHRVEKVNSLFMVVVLGFGGYGGGLLCETVNGVI
ncbi:hypothetical protein [Enterovibrio calviensis]|uniref:hypothetical protein n=1 Tax=Enterovibrio calviensis TaxID=91359 RepID=UPI0037350AA4